jgi:predicted Holliday junction resolvase-like endonuclease
MELETSTIVIIAVVALAILIVCLYFFYRYVFSIERQLWNQKQTIELLLRLVEKQEGNSEHLDYIRAANNNPEANISLRGL